MSIQSIRSRLEKLEQQTASKSGRYHVRQRRRRRLERMKQNTGQFPKRKPCFFSSRSIGQAHGRNASSRRA